MGQKFFEDSIGTLTQSSGTITLGTSSITVGGQQYQVSSVTYTLSGLVASTKYYLYAVVSGGVLTLVPSTNAITVGPAGYTSWKFIRAFTTNSSAGFGAFSGMISDPNPVGTIIHSMLTLTQFQSIYGTNWVLADGSDATNSMYALITGNTTVPDARGLFLRAAGTHGTLKTANNTAFSATLGSSQNDQTQGHMHYYTVYNGGFTGWGAQSYQNNTSPIASTGGVTSPITDGTNGNPRTGNETRPANLAVSIFIKINMD